MSQESNSLSSVEYVQHGGRKCPVCNSDDITTTSDIEVDGPHAWQAVACNHCNSEWTDTFVLSGYTNLSVGNKR